MYPYIFKIISVLILVSITVFLLLSVGVHTVANYCFFNANVWILHCNYRYYALLTTQESLQTRVTTGVHTAKNDVHTGKNTGVHTGEHNGQ